MSNQPVGYMYNPQGQAVTAQGANYPPAQGPPYAAPPGIQQYPPGPPAGYGQPVAGYGYPAPAGQPLQPTAVPGQRPPLQFMQAPPTIAGIPAGLEYLAQIDQLLVHQQVELFELFTGWETSNKYQIKNTVGQQVYFAGEESDMCMRQCCGPSRSFVMHITDNFGREVIRVSRDFKCCAGWNCCAGCDCCAMEVRIEAPVGEVIGYIKQRQSCLAPKFGVLDAHHDEVLMIEGPVCRIQGPCCTGDIEYRILSSDGVHQVGRISKQWTGLMKEYFTDADNFGVSFPMDLDVRVKASLIGAVFLIDFMYFEQKQDNNN